MLLSNELNPSPEQRKTEDEKLAKVMLDAAAGAVENLGSWALELGHALDFSPKSIPALEALLGALRQELPRGFWARLRGKAVNEEDLWLHSISPGAYLGEVLRRNYGACWTARHPISPGEVGYFMVLDGAHIAPVSKVFKRLADGPTENVASYFEWLVGDAGKAQRAKP